MTAPLAAVCRNGRHPHGPDYPRWLCRMGRAAKTPAWRPSWRRWFR